MLLPCVASAQFSIKGKITDRSSHQPLPGASISIGNRSSTSNSNGDFSITFLEEASYQVRIRYIGYKEYSRTIRISGDQTLDAALERNSFITDEVIVKATRAGENSATTYRNMNRQEIEKNNIGQDLPYLLNQTPSVVVSSDAGTGIGYTGIRIRGSDGTRINVTLNGIPLNDAESQGAFFVNLPDLASSVDNIQIQRGVGTSTNGAAAFGGSLNVQTTTRRDSAYAEINNTYGSFETWKNTVSVGTGLINDKFTFDARVSRIKSDGYIDRASSDLKSFFLTGAFYGKKDLIRANVFSGKEKTYQAWNGVPESILDTNRRYNEFTYEDQTDNYQQDHYQLLYTHTFNDKLSLNTALHYTYGRGYYEEFKDADSLKNYNISPVVIGGTKIETSNLIRRRWLDNDFYGLTYSLNYKPQNTLELILGGAYNEYRGDHFGEVIWAEVPYVDPASNYTSAKRRYYEDNAVKTDFNSYLRANYQSGKLNAFFDLQYRRIGYSFLGFDRNQRNVQQKDNLNFFNPKIGLTWLIDSRSNVYASFAVANKEPNRDDYTESTPESRPEAENLKDIEAGYRIRGENFQAGINAYGMFYKDQLILTGRINDVGEYTRRNVPSSYRTGIELDGQWRILPQLTWAATASLSRNKIRNFTEYVDDDNEQRTFEYKNTDIAFSPSFIGSSEISFRPVSNTEIAFLSKYVGKQYLDNTSNRSTVIDDPLNRDRVLSAFFVNDLRLRYNTGVGSIKDIGIAFQVNNIFSELYENNGYTFKYIYEGALYSGNGFYPQATRNFLLSLNVKF
ncbi:TonB-dependent receptor [Arcticibacter tournemirensis]|uniref:TonB-dependent receptor n=2 Tax=Arcticibacter tournemirensis TaxID=699437 RepID=A0A5M9GWX5_9SPHI|nr:TonB-dependent receptor [Arcticibacter tournemirensis]KAA8479202.1 TonB-dependent receptor [Arcticibacter tournemirensis]